MNDSILYAITEESDKNYYQIHELLKTNNSLNSYFYNYAIKSDTSIYDLLITEFYTIVLGESENNIMLHTINHNNFINYKNTEFKTKFYKESNNYYKHIVKLNDYNLSDPNNYKEPYYDYYLIFTDFSYVFLKFENVNA